MMILDLQPFSFVTDIGFQSFCATMDRNFKPAGRKYYSDLLVKVYDRGVSKLEDKIKKDDPEEVSCQLDGWSARQMKSLIINILDDVASLTSSDQQQTM